VEDGRELIKYIKWYKIREPNNVVSINLVTIALEEYKDTLGTLEKISDARILSLKLPASLIERIKGVIKT
jgi:hypothetical protein